MPRRATLEEVRPRPPRPAPQDPGTGGERRPAGPPGPPVRPDQPAGRLPQPRWTCRGSAQISLMDTAFAVPHRGGGDPVADNSPSMAYLIVGVPKSQVTSRTNQMLHDPCQRRLEKSPKLFRPKVIGSTSTSARCGACAPGGDCGRRPQFLFESGILVPPASREQSEQACSAAIWGDDYPAVRQNALVGSAQHGWSGLMSEKNWSSRRRCRGVV